MKKAIFGRTTKTALIIFAVIVFVGICVYGTILLGGDKNIALDNNSEIIAKDLATVADGAKAVDVIGVTVGAKVYDGTKNIDPVLINLSEAVINGLDDGDAEKIKLSVSSATLNSGDANNGDLYARAAIIFTLTDVELGSGIAAKYTVNNLVDVRVRINPKQLSVTGIVLKDRVYNATSTIEVQSGYILDGSGIVLADSGKVSLNIRSAVMNDKNAGEDKTIHHYNYELSGDKAGNYTVMFTAEQQALTVNIAKKPLLTENFVVGELSNKSTYNGTNNVTLKGSNWARIIHEGNGDGRYCVGDDVKVYTENITATVEDKNVGANKNVVLNIVLAGGDANNYAPYNEQNLVVEIIKANIVLKEVMAENKIYDKNDEISISNGRLDITIEIDRANIGFELSTKGKIDDLNVGNSKKVNYGATLTGSAKDNYNLILDRVTVDVTPLNLTATWANTKFVYSGLVNNVGIILQGIREGDTVSFEVKYTSVPNKRAGIDVVEGGHSAYIVLSNGNYIINEKTNTIVITPRVIEVAWSGYAGLIFDGSRKTVNAVVTNIAEGDTADLVMRNNGNQNAGYYQASVLSVTNPNYALPEETLIWDYVILARELENIASTAYKLNFKMQTPTGSDPNIQFHVVNIAENVSKAVYPKPSRDEKVFASYKMFTRHNDVDSDIKGTATITLQLSEEWSKAKGIKLAVYNGSTIEIVKGVIDKGVATFEVKDALEVTVIIEYGSITTLLVMGLIIAGLLLLIVIILILMYRFNNRKLLFDPSGGEPIEGLAGKYKQDIDLPTTERTECQFDAWFKAKNYKKKAEYSALPFWDTMLVARWKDKNGEYLPYQKGSIVLPAGRPIMAKVELANTISEQNAIKERTISFESRGGDRVSSITAVMGSSVKIPSPSGKEPFAGWFYDEALTQGATIKKMPKEDVLLYAKWASDRVIKEVVPLTVKVDKSDKVRTLVFETRGGSAVEPISAVRKSKISISTPLKSNDIFAYWSYAVESPKKLDLSTMPTADATCYAIWSSDLNPVGINMTDGAKRNKNLSDDFEKNVGTSAQVGVPSNVSNKIDELMFGKATMPTNRPLVDQARKEAQVNKPAQAPIQSAGQATYGAQSVNQTAPKATAQPIAPQPVQESVNLQDRLTVKALLFNTRGGHPIRPIQAKVGTPMDLPIPTKGESKFMGWYKDEGLTRSVDFNKMPSKNTMLFAKWIEDGTIQEVYDEGLVDVAEQKASKADFEAKQKTIETMLKGDERPIDDIVIMRSSNAKKSMLVDDSKK